MKTRDRLVWLYGGYALLVGTFPPILKFLARVTYNRIASKYPTTDMTFMNLGYLDVSNSARPRLDPNDERNRLPIQLYHHVGTLIDLTGLRVLEVGCGRGGGASYVKRYLHPSSMVGMDLADRAIEFCRQTHNVDGLRFIQGDAEKIPLQDDEFDVVMNVESSHCYPVLDKFFREVRRVLRPGGYFLYTDFLLTEDLPVRRQTLQSVGFDLEQERDILPNVLAALDANTEERVALANSLAPVLGATGARQWTVTPGSKALEGMRAGVLSYVSMVLRDGSRTAEA